MDPVVFVRSFALPSIKASFCGVFRVGVPYDVPEILHKLCEIRRRRQDFEVLSCKLKMHGSSCASGEAVSLDSPPTASLIAPGDG